MTRTDRRILGWYFFDWASQPYATLLVTFIFAPYFAEVARTHYTAGGMDPAAAGAAAQALWGAGLGIAGATVAVLAPLLGAVADGSGRRIAWVRGFSILYVAGSAALWWLAPDGTALLPALAAFGLGFVAMEFATIFTNALLPSLGPRDRIGAISGSGFAFGYVGGLVALVLFLALFAERPGSGLTLAGIPPVFGLDPDAREGTRAVGPFTAVWYALFMLPFFLWVKEPARPAVRPRIGAAIGDLGRFLRGLRGRPSLAAFLGSSLLYRDALAALYGFGGIYAFGVLGWSVVSVGLFGILGAMAGAAGAWIGGQADRRRGPRPVIAATILILVAVCAVVAGLTRETLFGLPLPEGSTLPDAIFAGCGALIGAAGGALQSASRTMMVRHATPGRETEAFGFYALSGKVTSFLAPMLIAVATAASGSQRIGILPLIPLFLGGLLLLGWVRAEGEHRAGP